jgi:hypothetical protein
METQLVIESVSVGSKLFTLEAIPHQKLFPREAPCDALPRRRRLKGDVPLFQRKIPEKAIFPLFTAPSDSSRARSTKTFDKQEKVLRLLRHTFRRYFFRSETPAHLKTFAHSASALIPHHHLAHSLALFLPSHVA